MYQTGHSFGIPLFMGFGAGVAMLGALAIVIGFAILIALKGYALWHAATRHEMWWFIALLAINTGGILEVIYIIFVVKKYPNILPKKTHPHHHEDHHNHSHDHNHEK